MSPAFVAKNIEEAQRPKNVGKWCDWQYFDGLKDSRGYTDPQFDYRKGYGLTYWSDGFLGTAKYLAERFSPLFTFLELGCAKGFLVQAMRMIGIEAYGMDISEYAVSNCHPDMKDYIFCQNATDLSRFKDEYFDLVYSWDFLEHLYPQELHECLKECRRVGKGWMRHGITVFDKDYVSIAEKFPEEPQDPTHVSCYKRDWWERMFRVIFSKEEIREVNLSNELFKEGDKRRSMLEIVIKLNEEKKTQWL